NMREPKCGASCKAREHGDTRALLPPGGEDKHHTGKHQRPHARLWVRDVEAPAAERGKWYRDPPRQAAFRKCGSHDALEATTMPRRTARFASRAIRARSPSRSISCTRSA